jgi:hypothetical protein
MEGIYIRIEDEGQQRVELTYQAPLESLEPIASLFDRAFITWTPGYHCGGLYGFDFQRIFFIKLKPIADLLVVGSLDRKSQKKV